MSLTSITIMMGIVGVLAIIFILGWKRGKKEEGYRWHNAWNTQLPIKFKNRLYEVKKVNIEDFIDE